MANNETTSEDTPLIIIASNRGPFSFTQKEDGSFDSQRGAGGLVTALASLAEQHEVLWIACTLSADDRQWAIAQEGKAQKVENILLRLIVPEPNAYHLYYNIIANPLLWFIQHQMWDAPRNPSITRDIWDAWKKGYTVINQQFADVIAEEIKGSSRRVIVLPQDYHLYLLPKMLRDQVGDAVQIQPFCHIPWCGSDAWNVLPGQIRRELLEGLLASNRVGFQTTRDAFNFVQTCRIHMDEAHSGGARDAIEYRGKKVGAKHYPISIDADKVTELADSNEVRLYKQQLINTIGDNRLILRIDRVEPSKNILRGLEAYRALLKDHPEYHGKVKMMLLLVPSRMGLDEYLDYLADIMAEAGLINAHYSDGFWEPVRAIVGDNYVRAIAALQLYDVLLINPIADGMNLVAKEGVLVNQKDGVLILSENAGAVYELGKHAITVSPFDVHGTAESLHLALSMDAAEKTQRAEALRQRVRDNDVKRWFARQIQDALTDLSK